MTPMDKKLIALVHQMSEPQRREMANKIWGDDIEYEEWADEDYIREDVTGSIMDLAEKKQSGELDEPAQTTDDEYVELGR